MTNRQEVGTAGRDSQGGLEVRDLRIHREGFEIRVNLHVRPGQRVALLGRSGCGKTTLLRAIAGLEPVHSGQVCLVGDDVTHLPTERRNLGVVFQDLALFPSLTVEQNLDFGLRVRGVSRKERELRLAPWVERFGLKGREKAALGYLSGGERQRVALIRTWVTKPRVLLLDEPFSALDAVLRADFQQLLMDLLAKDPVPVLWVTHDVSDLDRFATDQVAVRESSDGAIREFLGP